MLAGLLLLACGIFIGYKYEERVATLAITTFSAGIEADNARSSAMTLEAIQRNELNCARWLLRSRVSGLTKNMNQRRLDRMDGNMTRQALDRLEQVASYGNHVLASIEEANFDISAGCNLQ